MQSKFFVFFFLIFKQREIKISLKLQKCQLWRNLNISLVFLIPPSVHKNVGKRYNIRTSVNAELVYSTFFIDRGIIITIFGIETCKAIVCISSLKKLFWGNFRFCKNAVKVIFLPFIIKGTQK